MKRSKACVWAHTHDALAGASISRQVKQLDALHVVGNEARGHDVRTMGQLSVRSSLESLTATLGVAGLKRGLRGLPLYISPPELALVVKSMCVDPHRCPSFSALLPQLSPIDALPYAARGRGVRLACVHTLRGARGASREPFTLRRYRSAAPRT